MVDERRCAIRWNIVLPVRYLGMPKHVEGTCRTRDLSTLGAKLETADKYNPGDRLDLMLEMTGSGGEPICVEADVVWQTSSDELHEECNYLTGVVFRKIRDYHKKSILDYVNVNHPQMLRERWWDGV